MILLLWIRKEIRSIRLNAIFSLLVLFSTCYWLGNSPSKARITSRFSERINHARFDTICLNSIRFQQVRRISWRRCLMHDLNIVSQLRNVFNIHSCTSKVNIITRISRAAISDHTKSNSSQMSAINKWIHKKWLGHSHCIPRVNSLWTEVSTRLDRYLHARIHRFQTSNARVNWTLFQELVFLIKVDRTALIITCKAHLRTVNRTIIRYSKQRWSRTVITPRNSEVTKNARNAAKKNMKKTAM